MEVNETEYQNIVIVMKRGCSTELLVRHPLIPASSESGESAGYRDVGGAFHRRWSDGNCLHLFCGGRFRPLTLPEATERIKKICQKEKRQFSSVRIADMSPRNGWVNVRDAGSGILL